MQQEGVTIPADGFALVRLHTGNFTYFLDLAEKGKDIRVLAGDEATPLKFYIEKLDPVNEMAFIWVKLPKDIATNPEPSFWLYYGNAEAVDGQDAPGAFEPSEVLVYEFDPAGIKDLTAYAHVASEATATTSEGGLIGAAAAFQGGQIIRVASAPSLAMAPATGWTAETWVKVEQAQNSVIFQRYGVTLAVKELAPVLQITDATGAKKEFPANASLTATAWQHLAVVATASDISLYVNGVAAGTFPVVLAELTGDLTIGADTSGAKGFSGLLDQFVVYKVARDANAIKFDSQMQGANSAVLTYGEDATPDSEEGESYIMGTLNSVTIDGWVIIGILAVMFVISWIVMISKAIVLSRTASENKKFEEAFGSLSVKDLSTLNREDDENDADFEESPLLLSLTASHGAFTGSSIYRIYHVGVEEMNRRLNKNKGTDIVLSAQAMNAVKASMDAVLVRELQKLNAQMVLLTIAISGGPFLGLLGTVVGVMITFAAIAVSGEVNVNSIAPGIAAALTATVAGLMVAIPCLFGYNYLGGRIKSISADMHVFVDEFIAKMSEQHT
ncbi:MAG: DUF2341 domain-containing protein [Methylovulum sp.]|nr:DUF2341 domain-containing protein [Methylovulum sp.]